MKFLLLGLLPLALWAKSFTVASYNVENLFDLVRNGSEYPEYIPRTHAQWNEKTYAIKRLNIARVLKDLDADIVGLSEIENEQALNDLQATLAQVGAPYTYRAITKSGQSSVRVALLSRFPIISTKDISVGSHKRAILQAYIAIGHANLVVFVNHWKSKSGPESHRLIYAKALLKALKALPKKQEYLIIGDLNSNYNEYLTFKKEQRLNNTKGITGINHVLKTLHLSHMVTPQTLTLSHEPYVHYNPWIELPSHKRFSHIFRGQKGTLDHIIMPKTLFDGKGIEYEKESFEVFMPQYLVKKERINHWKMRYGNTKQHMGKGYSDHLPVRARFRY